MPERAAFVDQTCYRLIPSKFPPIALFDDVADAEDFEDLFAVQAMTNPRLKEQVGNLDAIPGDDRVYGIPGAGYVMAAFTHINPDGSRFSNGDFGIYYAAALLQDAIEGLINACKQAPTVSKTSREMTLCLRYPSFSAS